MPEVNPSIQAAVQANQQQINALIDALGLKLLDPTVEPEFRAFAIERIESLLSYLKLRYPAE